MQNPIPDNNSQQVRNRAEPPQFNKEHLQKLQLTHFMVKNCMPLPKIGNKARMFISLL